MLVQLLGRPQVHEAILVTAAEVIVAFVIAVPLGAAIGVLIAENDYFGQIFKPLLFYVFSVPKSIFLPMFILIMGIGFQQKVAYAAFSTLFVVHHERDRGGRVGARPTTCWWRAPTARRGCRSSRASTCRA